MENLRINNSIVIPMPSILERLSILLNKWIYKEEGNPICYTVYRNKSYWYKVLDSIFFWQKQHCRRTYLSKRLHENNK